MSSYMYKVPSISGSGNNNDDDDVDKRPVVDLSALTFGDAKPFCRLPEVYYVRHK